MGIAYTLKTDRLRLMHTSDPDVEAPDGEDGFIPADNPPDGASVFVVRPLNASERQQALTGDPVPMIQRAVVSIEEGGKPLSESDQRALIDGCPQEIIIDLANVVLAVTDGPFPLHRPSS